MEAIMKKYKYIIIILFFINIPSFSFANKSYISETTTINARHAIVLDRASSTILYGKQEKEICKMASTTKIMTAIIVIETCSNLHEEVIISKTSARNWRF